jgi:drug/metabolite transporter (DMT)-like permease
LEPVFAGVFGVLLGGDRLGVATVVGAALVIAAMLIIELSPRPDAARPVERLEV